MPARPSKKRRDRPEYPIAQVRALAGAGKLTVEPRALATAIEILPYSDPRPRAAARNEIAHIVQDLRESEFMYSQTITGRTPADVYRVSWEDVELYVKLKIEADLETGEEEVVAVISFKPWT